MKKALALLLALTVVGFVFAEDAAYSVSGSATLTWGVDLNTTYTGFKNEADFSISFPIAKGASKTASGEGVYGKIAVTKIWLSVDDTLTRGNAVLDDDDDSDDNNNASVAAAIWMDKFYVTVYNRKTLTNNKAEDLLDGDVSATIAANTMGTAFGMDTDTFDFALIANSKGDWTANTLNEYAFGAQASFVVPDVVTVNVGVAHDTLDATADFGAYITAPMTFGPLSVTPKADISLPEGGAFDADARLDVTFNLTADEGDKANIGAIAYYSMGDNDVEAEVSVTEPATGGFVDGLGAGVTFDLYNPINALSWKAKWNLDFKAMMDDTYYVKPYHTGSVNSNTVLALTFGVEAKLIANTVFTLDYTAKDLLNNDAAEANDIGIITAKAKISL